MANKLKNLLFFFLLGAIFPLTAFAGPSYVVTGYVTYDALSSYPVSVAFSNPVNNGATGGIPWADLSHINFGFVTIGTTTAYLDDPAGMVPALIAQAHANGVRVYMTLGGATPAAQWSSITSTGNAQSLANSVTALMVQSSLGGQPQTFDGVDVDCEFPGQANFPSTTIFSDFVQDLRTNLNKLTPGLAPSGKYSGESSVGETMYLSPGNAVCGYNFTSLNANIDWYMLSGYDMNDQVPGDQWNAALTDTTTIGTCVPSTVTDDIKHMAAWYNTNDGGIPYSKMTLGMPFFGSNDGGTAFVADNAEFTSGSAGTYNTGTAECIYGGTYSMDTAQSFCDKMNWAMSSAIGMKGIGIWDLTDGLPVTANAMMTNIWNTIAGTSCVTISTPCAACTSTPTPVPLPSCGVLVDNFENGSYFTALGYADTASYGGGCGSTVNPVNGAQWIPSIGYGLSGSQIGGRMYGTLAATSSGCWGPTMLLGLGGYNAGASVNAFTFNIRVDGGNNSGGTTFVVGTLNTATQYQYNYLLSVPAADVGSETSAAASVVSSKWGTTMAVTVFFSQLTPNGTGEPVYSDSSLYDLYFEPYNPTASGTWTGNYDYTVDNIYFLCAPTPTPTPTITNTFTATKTFTNTPIPPTNTFTNTPVPPTSTFTNTNTKTNTPVPPTNTFTNTPVPPTNTFTNTFTKTNTPVPPTNTFTNTPANTNTFTFTPVFTNTKTNTPVPPTNTFTNTPANTNTFTNTPTITNTNTPVPPTNTFTFTNTKTNTPVPPTNTFTNTPANTNTFTLTPTFTNTKTNTPVPPTNTFTNTPTITNTPTNTGTPTNTYTGTIPPTNTPTNSLSPTNSFTNTWTNTSTNTPVPPTNTFTNTFTFTSTNTPANTNTPTNSFTPTFTSTDTFTFTNTDTPTNTDSPTSTGTPTNSFTGTVPPSDTPTNTPTNTWTGTPTNSFTSTNTSAFTDTPTPTNSFTSSFTPTATFTATQPVVQLGNGPNSPSNTTVPAGSSNQVVLQVSVDNTSGESLQLSDLDLTFTGTGNAASGIVSVTLWKNPSGDGSTSDSTVLATVNSPFASGNNALVAFNDTVGAGATQDYLITYNFASGASAGTYSVSLANSSALSGQGTVSLQSLHVQGAPVNGALLTVTALTATPSFTATVTSSFTPVPPTATSTETPIVRVTIGNPYPNPINGTGDLSINVTAPGASSLDFAVFTTSFRKIWDDSIPVPQGASVIHWNLRDREGIPVSDGLYYIRLQVIGLHTTTKIFKVLVLQ